MMRDKEGKFISESINSKYGKLTIIEFDHKYKSGIYYYKCRCDCGKVIVTRKTLLSTGKKTSCGCDKKSKIYGENKFEINGNCATIFAGTKKVAIIDLEDLEKVSKYYWNRSNRHAYSYTCKKKLHQFLLGAKNIDHINGDITDNRKSNLRVCTHQENCMNRGIRSDNKTGIPGVQKRFNKWIAKITYKGQNFQKTFATIEEAKNYRKKLEMQHFKEFARKVI